LPNLLRCFRCTRRHPKLICFKMFAAMPIPYGMPAGGMAPGGMAPGGMAPGGMAAGGMAPGGMAAGGMAAGGMAPGGMAAGMVPAGGVAIASNKITGSVKSWNGSKGYGFIKAPGVATDLMFLRSELPPDAKEVRGKFLEGKTVKFEVHPGNQGKAQATKIEIMPVPGEFLAGQIKSFSEKHGYGFITSSMCPGSDVRFNRQDFDLLMPGVNLREQLVIFQTQTTPDGKLRVSKVMFQSSKIAQDLKMGFGMGPMGPHGFGKGGFFPGGGYGAYGGKGGFGNYGPRPKGPSVSVTPTGQFANGVVKSYNAGRGFGFISCQGSPADVFFLRSDLPEAARSAGVQGCSVNFELMRTSDGKLRASQITTF